MSENKRENEDLMQGQVVYATRTWYPGPFQEYERAVLSFLTGEVKPRKSLWLEGEQTC